MAHLDEFVNNVISEGLAKKTANGAEVSNLAKVISDEEASITEAYAKIGELYVQQHSDEGDESELQPMILKDIADKTGLDISTISRVSNVKYVQTRWGTFPLRFFFTESYTTESGEELSTRKIKLALKDIIDSEDKHHPYSDERLTQMMKEKGMTVARRTVAKYREQLGIPVARLRKE